jgi:hypothetical protein
MTLLEQEVLPQKRYSCLLLFLFPCTCSDMISFSFKQTKKTICSQTIYCNFQAKAAYLEQITEFILESAHVLTW